MRTIILSVKPEFSKKICFGDKKIELRKQIGKYFVPGNKIFIYESSPSKILLASCVIEKIESINVNMITFDQLSSACVERTFYDTYFNDKKVAHLIYLENVELMQQPLTLEFLRTFKFTPPQSFCYASEALLELLMDDK